MVAEGVSPSTAAKRPFAAFVASSADGLRREVRADARRRGLPPDVDVDDVVQTAFVKLMPVYERLDTEFAAFNYAHKTALRALSDLRRRERVRHEGWLESVYRRTHRAAPDPEEEALRELRAADVRAAFGRLPDNQRRALALVDVADLRQADAADVMGVSATTIKGLVQRGREALRRDLREVCGVAALFRLRRPSALAPVAAAPGVLAMAFVLTVAHAPAVPAPVPYVVVEAAAPRPATVVAERAGPTVSSRATRTPARPRPVRKPAAAPERRERVAPEPPLPSLPEVPASACAGGRCVLGGEHGDEVCVNTPETSSCFGQAFVGVCPAVGGRANPVVTCTRHDTPFLDPVPAR